MHTIRTDEADGTFYYRFVLLQKHNEALVARIRSLDLKGLRFVSRRQTESIARNAAHKRVPTPWHSLFAQPFSSVDQELRAHQ